MMTKPKLFQTYLAFSITAALAYGFTAFYFIQESNYTYTWVLYLGNFLFMTIIIGFLFSISRKLDPGTKTLSLIKAGLLTTVMGVIISCLLSFLLLLIMVHGLLGKGVPGKVMIDKPVNTIHDRTNGLDFMLIVNSIIGNFATGAFVSLIFSTSLYKKRRSKPHTVSN